MTPGDLKAMSGVYAVINTVTGRFYIGSARDLYTRRKSYSKGFNKILRGEDRVWGVSRRMVADVRTHGRDVFVFRVLEMFPRSEWEALSTRDPHYVTMLEDTYIVAAQTTSLYNTHQAFYADIPLWKAG